MKRILLLLLVSLFGKCYGQIPDTPLFKIVENNKIGYIDSTGKVIIKPQFRNAGDFSEGLAYARINGTYGFINQKGDYVIQPQYDYATAFQEGLAVVYLDGKPFYIDKEGRKPFQVHFPLIQPFKYGRAKIRTSTGKSGFIDKQGKIIIDTAFAFIHDFIEGLAVVRSVNHQDYDNPEKGLKKKYEIGVIDSLGRFFIPYGKFKWIYNLAGGYFKVDLAEASSDNEKSGFVDKRGQLHLIHKLCENCQLQGELNSGLVRMTLYKYWLPENKKRSYSSDRYYGGFMNIKGEIAINDTTYQEVNSFSENRAFIKAKGENYSLINNKGEVIAKNAYQDIKFGFKNGKAFVETEEGWGLIDTTGHFIINPKFDEINFFGLVDDYFFFEKLDDDENKYNDLIGVANIDGTVLISPILEEISFKGFQNGLLECTIKGKQTYFNKAGEKVWQGGKNKPSGDTNIDYMNRGYFYAASERNEYDLGGFGGSDNRPKVIDKSHSFPNNSLSIVVQNSRGKETNVFVTNTTNGQINFRAQDSRLNMKVQALDKEGVWRDIEYLPNSWCGNSYHTLTLKPKQYWAFNTPHYQGDFQTKLRIELKYLDPDNKSRKREDRKEQVVYSNEFIGSVNPGQFWRKPDYVPGGLMDPYFE